MRLNYVIIYVSDVAAATEYYSKAFNLTVKFLHDSNSYGEMETGETTLAFASNDMMKAAIGIDARKGLKNCFEIAFSTADVKPMMDRAVSHGARVLKEPVEKPWGQTVAYVEDPFGTIIEICTPMD
jgi:predicted enzyme related to lactoylglutathione lyase